MPVYEYFCCGNKEHIVRSFKEEELVPKCVICAEPMKRLFGVAAVTFKGNGWGKDA